MKARYEAVSLAKKIVSLANNNDLYITNLQLQKVLYYVQGTFMNKFKEKAFAEDMECWPYGPVVKKVWSTFNVFGRNPIRNCSSNLQLLQCEENIIIDILLKKLNMNVWDLVDQTHEEIPWKRANESHSIYLKDEDMKEFFCR